MTYLMMSLNHCSHLHSFCVPARRPTLHYSAKPFQTPPEGPSKDMVRVSQTTQVAVPRRALEARADPSIEQMQDKLARISVIETPAPTGAVPPQEIEIPHPHLFAIGDTANAFGTIKAGYTAHY